MPQFIPRTSIPEIFIPGFIAYLELQGKSASFSQKMFPSSYWNKFKNELGTLPEKEPGSHFVLDTEFTDLKDGLPISIALVCMDNDSSETFYIELSDTYTDKDCSSFVKTDVLPYLKGDIFEHDTETARGLIIEFLEKFPKPWHFWSDHPKYDNGIVNHIIDEKHYVSKSMQQIDYLLSMCYVRYSRKAPEFDSFDMHNALDDAKRYAITWNKISDSLITLRDEPDVYKP